MKHYNEILRLNFKLVSTVSKARHIMIFFDSLMQTTYKTKMKILLLVAKKYITWFLKCLKDFYFGNS